MIREIFSYGWLICMLVYAGGVGAQTVANERMGHSSAILDMSNTGDKAFLPPRVELGDLGDQASPVANPAEGLIVYNVGAVQLPGYYIWEDGLWNLLATRDNSVESAVYRSAGSSSITGLGTAGNFQSLNLFPQEVSNTIGLTYSGGTFTVPGGKYVMHVVLNITTNEAADLGIGGTSGSVQRRANLHNYTGRIVSGVTLGEAAANATSSGGTNGNKTHQISMTFPFELYGETTNFTIQLARRAGGTFNGASVTVNHAFVHIEKSLP